MVLVQRVRPLELPFLLRKPVELASIAPVFRGRYVEVNVRKDLGVEHPMYLLMDKDSRLAMTTLNGVNAFFVKLGDMFNAYLEQKRIEDIPAVPRASDGEADLDPWSLRPLAALGAALNKTLSRDSSLEKC